MPGSGASLGDSSSSGSSTTVTRRSRRHSARRCASTTFTASRCSQVPNALSCRNPGSRSHARTNTSWVRSSAADGVALEPEAHGMDPPHVRPVERREGIGVAGLGATDLQAQRVRIHDPGLVTVIGVGPSMPPGTPGFELTLARPAPSR